MEKIRIINDYVSLKGEPVTCKVACDEFNKRIVAVQEMFRWMYGKGILKDVSFQYKEFTTEPEMVYFAFDAKDNEPYREQMLNSGTKDADLAVRYIFDEDISPCLYCGAIELTWLMQTYRDTCGCVGRSWECWACKSFYLDKLSEVLDIKREKGPKEAVKKLWSFIEWKE